MKDVAEVRIGHAVRYGALTYKDQGEVAGAVVLMLKGANASKVIRGLKERIEQVKKSLPEGVVITPVNMKDQALGAAAEKLYQECKAAGLDPVLDDRDERPGVKFKDADLIGIPFRIVCGKKLGEGLVELYIRKTKEKTDVPLADVVLKVKSLVAAS